MIIDARTVDEDEVVETDVCIVGAGPAGIALARECIGEDFRVCLLESGGFEADEALHDLSKGESVGLAYDRLDDARYRAFGGASRTWSLDVVHSHAGVRLRALDPIDFEKRDWVPHSGWPFDRAHLEPFYERAHRFFAVGPVDYDPARWEDARARPRLPLGGDRVTSTVFQFGRAETLVEPRPVLLAVGQPPAEQQRRQRLGERGGEAVNGVSGRGHGLAGSAACGRGPAGRLLRGLQCAQPGVEAAAGDQFGVAAGFDDAA